MFLFLSGEVISFDGLIRAGSLVSGRVLAEEVLERSSLLSFFVVELDIHTGLVFLGVKLKSRERFNFNTFVFILSGIVLGDNKSINSLDSFTESVPVRSKSSAVTAPGSVVLHEDIVIRFHNFIFEGVSNNNSDGSVVVSRGILRLSEGLERSSGPVVNEFSNRISSGSRNVSFVSVFVDTSLGRNNNSNARHILSSYSNEFSELLLNSISDTRVRE